MDLIDLSNLNGDNFDINYADHIKSIFREKCANAKFYKKSDIEEHSLKNGKSISIFGSKVFEISEKTGEKVLLCKYQILEHFDLLKYTALDDTSDVENIAMIKIVDVKNFLSVIEDLVYPIYIYCLNLIQVDTFGCCNSFIECSNKKECVSKDREFYLGCCYRRNLENGKIFYGKNKNC
jgi:hypothetical protein